MRSAGFELVSRSCTRFLGRFFGFNAKWMSLTFHVPGKARANRLREDEHWSSDTVSYASNRLYGVGSANPATITIASSARNIWRTRRRREAHQAPAPPGAQRR